MDGCGRVLQSFLNFDCDADVLAATALVTLDLNRTLLFCIILYHAVGRRQKFAEMRRPFSIHSVISCPLPAGASCCFPECRDQIQRPARSFTVRV